MTEQEQYYAARIAARDSQDAAAFLRLGELYSKGIGTRENHVLAKYFYDKARALGCEEAEEYIVNEYENDDLDLASEIDEAFKASYPNQPESLGRFKLILEEERAKKNYGILSPILHRHMHYFYPDYNQEKAIDDLLNDRDTLDAELFYATFTEENQSEFNLGTIDCLLQQMYAPVLQDNGLLKEITEQEEPDILNEDEKELIESTKKLRSTYTIICDKHKITPETITPIDALIHYPYIKTSAMVSLRKQSLKCLLSVKDYYSVINDTLLDNLYDTDNIISNIIVKIEDEDLLDFILSFFEFNVDINVIILRYQNLLHSYKSQQLETLARTLNDFSERLTDTFINHQLPLFTPDNLPPIDLSVEVDDKETNLKGQYSILQNPAGEIFITIDAEESTPQDPYIIYDGKIAMLFRNFESNILFRNIEPKAKKALNDAQEAHVVEMLNGKTEREYTVPIKRVGDVGVLIM
ncbi:MAG: sel1 repeat family protein [Bacteroidaceae bacterium]|nr:sel1 repeat family protein [Bacteroidaceae bacterium]